MWDLFEFINGFFNTDGTPMQPNSPIDIEGKLFGQNNPDSSPSLFNEGWGNNSHGGGFGSDF